MQFSVGFGVGPLRATQQIGMPTLDGYPGGQAAVDTYRDVKGWADGHHDTSVREGWARSMHPETAPEQALSDCFQNLFIGFGVGLVALFLWGCSVSASLPEMQRFDFMDFWGSAFFWSAVALGSLAVLMVFVGFPLMALNYVPKKYAERRAFRSCPCPHPPERVFRHIVSKHRHAVAVCSLCNWRLGVMP